MKAFEKYNSKFSTPKQQKDDPIKSLLTRTRRETWRAALEWLQKNDDAYCCGDCDAVGDWTDCPKNTAIKQELED